MWERGAIDWTEDVCRKGRRRVGSHADGHGYFFATLLLGASDHPCSCSSGRANVTRRQHDSVGVDDDLLGDVHGCEELGSKVTRDDWGGCEFSWFVMASVRCEILSSERSS